MIVKCDKCGTGFDIQENLIKKSGTKLRCSNCSHIFKAYPPPPPAAPEKPEDKEDKTVASPPPGKTPGKAPDMPAGADEKKSSQASDNTMTMVDFSEDVFDSFSQEQERYIEMGSIGEGGMGEVRLAKDTQLLRKVAVKVLKKEAAASPAALSYFFREAQITAQLDHPNIVPLYTVKEPDQNERNVSFVMKLVKGQTLGDVISKARNLYKENPKAVLGTELDLNARLGYFLKACDGVSYAHRKEVIHRDLKPSNIMVGDYGEVYVMDWGIAKMIKEIPETLYGIQKLAAQKSGLYVGGTQLGSVVGTPGYISPEQVRGEPDVGFASDQYSMGLTLYELVTLRPARPGDTLKKLEKAEKGEFNKIASVVPEQKIPAELKAIIKKATAFEENRRYPSVAAMADDVRRFLRGDEVSQLPDNLPRKMWRLMNKHRQLTAIVILAALLVTSTLAIVSLYNEQAALNAARHREKKITRLMSEVSTQAHKIDTRFIRLEMLVVGIANNAVNLIENGLPNHEKLYWQEDYFSKKTGPPDLALSPLYGQQVSIDYPVVKLAPDIKKTDVLATMQKLAPLRHSYKKLLLDSRGSYAPLGETEIRRRMTIHGLPVSWAYIGLEAGVMFSYPGKGKYPKGYDPRVRPWYRPADYKKSVFWGKYSDIQGLGTLLFCAKSIYGKEGQFYGVAGIDVTYSNIIQENLMRPGSVGVKESFLLNDKGRIVVRSSQLGMESQSESGNSALKSELFPAQEVVDRILRRESGLVDVPGKDDSRLILFHEISSLRWYYVEEVSSAAIFDTEK